MLLEDRGAVEDAEGYYLRGSSSGDRQARLRLAALYTGSGRLHEARELLDGVTARDSRTQWQLGDRLKALGDVAAAREAYERAIATGGERACYDLAELLAGTGDDTLVEALFKRAIAAGDKWAYSGLGLFLRGEGRTTEAFELFESAVNAGIDTVLIPFANLLAESPQTWHEAERMHRQAIEVGDVEGNHNLALLLRRMGRRAEARSLEVHAALAGDPRARAALEDW